MTDWQAIDDTLLDPHWYAKGETEETFETLRREDPVHQVDGKAYGRPYWALTSYDAVRQVLDDANLFSNRVGSRMPRVPKRYTPEQRHQMGLDVRLVSIDPPFHQLYRRPMNKHFSVPAIARMTDDVAKICDGIIAKVAAKKDFDLIDDVAAELPMQVVLRLLGVPEEDWPHLKLCTMRYGLAADPRYTIDNDPVKTALMGAAALDEYTGEFARIRRADPHDDMATIISQLRVDGDELSLHEVRSWFSLLILGGLETTRNLVGTMTWALLERPDQRQLLLDQPSLMPRAIEEGLRWGTPVRSVMRIANEDTEVGDKYVRAGDWLLALLVSANRDEKIWKDSNTFDITRDEVEHTALGHGPHKCLGRSLLRLEMREMMHRLLTVFPDLEMTGRPEWQVDIALNGFLSMPMTTGADVRV